VRLLLDTHALLWWLGHDRRMPARAIRAVSAERNDVYVSSASVWEIVIKVGAGRLELGGPPATVIPDQLELNGFTPLAVELSHVLEAVGLPPVHRDPFDRLLVAQAIREQLVLVTADEHVRSYPVRTLWE